MEETNGMGITTDKTYIDRGQGSSDSMLRLLLIFSSFWAFLGLLAVHFQPFWRCVQKLSSLAARLVGCNARWFKYDRDDLCVNKSQFVPVIFEPPCIISCWSS
jgi:hypothetical protein